MDIKKKKICINLSFKKIMFYLNIFLVILFLSLFIFVGGFLKNNVYEVISVEDQIILDNQMANSLVINLNIEKFKKIIKNIEEKTFPREIKNFKDIFK